MKTERWRVWASPASLRCGPWARHIFLVQPRKTCPYISERVLMGRKESNQTNKSIQTCYCVGMVFVTLRSSDFIWPFLRPYMGVIPNPKMAFIFPISCILALIFPILIKYFPKCVGKGSFPKSQIKSLRSRYQSGCSMYVWGLMWLSNVNFTICNTKHD